MKFGGKPRLTPERIDHTRNLIDKGGARQYLVDLLKVGHSTLYRALTDSGEPRPCEVPAASK